MQKRHDARWPWLAAFASLAIVLTGVIATGANAGKTRASASKSESNQCATIDRNNVEKQTNARAGEILAACGRAPSRPPNDRLFTAVGQL